MQTKTIDLEREPQIYQVERVDFKSDRECERWVGDGLKAEPCTNKATHVFVFERNPNRDERGNCLACEHCCPDVYLRE